MFEPLQNKSAIRSKNASENFLKEELIEKIEKNGVEFDFKI